MPCCWTPSCNHPCLLQRQPCSLALGRVLNVLLEAPQPTYSGLLPPKTPIHAAFPSGTLSGAATLGGSSCVHVLLWHGGSCPSHCTCFPVVLANVLRPLRVLFCDIWGQVDGVGGTWKHEQPWPGSSPKEPSMYRTGRQGASPGQKWKMTVREGDPDAREEAMGPCVLWGADRSGRGRI